MAPLSEFSCASRAHKIIPTKNSTGHLTAARSWHNSCKAKNLSWNDNPMKNVARKKFIFTTLILSALTSGCATRNQDVSPSQSYRPKGTEELWIITGNLDNQFTTGLVATQVKRVLHIQINGEEVISGRLSSNATGELSGSYKKHSLIATCSSEKKTQNWIDVRCMILVNNERAVTLTF